MRGGFIYFCIFALVACGVSSLVYFEIHLPKGKRGTNCCTSSYCKCLEIAYTYKGRLARDFGGIFEYFLKYVDLILANPIEFCENHTIRNAKEIKGFYY